MDTNFTSEQINQQLTGGYAKAENILNDEDKMERFLQRLEKKLSNIPALGGALSEVPVMISLVKSYIRKEYTELPAGTVIAVISALIYFLSPVDLIPDFIPGVGLLDDAAVVALCLSQVKSDLDEYKEWRAANGKCYDV